jgi:hypothetical protein
MDFACIKQDFERSLDFGMNRKFTGTQPLLVA